MENKLESNNSIVHELQRLASNNSQDLSELLRKSLLVATKLQLSQFRQWILNELNGYSDQNVPDYRKFTAELKLKIPQQGYIPFIIQDDKISNDLLNVKLTEPIGSIIDVLKQAQKNNYGNLTIPIPPKQIAFLMKLQNTYGEYEPVRTIGCNSGALITDCVRTRILEWALQLETDGILGNGLTFNEEDKKKAKENQQIYISNFQGILGDVENSNINQHLNMKINKNDFDSLKAYLQQNGINESDLDELQSSITQDSPPSQSGLFGENVSTWIGKMIQKAADGSWKIGIGAAGGLLAKAISTYYGF